MSCRIKRYTTLANRIRPPPMFRCPSCAKNPGNSCISTLPDSQIGKAQRFERCISRFESWSGKTSPRCSKHRDELNWSKTELVRRCFAKALPERVEGSTPSYSVCQDGCDGSSAGLKYQKFRFDSGSWQFFSVSG